MFTPEQVCLLVILRFGHYCFGTVSITSLICSGRNRTEPDTGYSHLLACSSVTFTEVEMLHTYIYHLTTLHVTYLPGIRRRSIFCSIVILYAKYLEKCFAWSGYNRKCFETGPKRCCSGPEQYQYRSGTISNVFVLNTCVCYFALNYELLLYCDNDVYQHAIIAS